MRLLKEKTSRVEIDVKKGGEKAGERGQKKGRRGGGGCLLIDMLKEKDNITLNSSLDYLSV